MSNRRLITLVALILVGLTTSYWAKPQTATITTPVVTPDASAPAGFVRVARVVDGDTIELANGQKVRYLGMDTPETVNPKKPVQCFGKEASNYNKNLVGGQYVRLVRDVEDKDKYGRLLRYVYMEDGTFVNLTLVTQGYAYAYTYPPNVAHAKEFVAAQAQARTEKLGLWASCPAR
jgi:micrococcal nuclease